MRDMGVRRHEYEPAATAADLPVPRGDGASVASDDEDSDDEFEFPSVSREPAAAEELFVGGRIRAFYPVFGRVLDDEAAASASTQAPKAPLGRLFQLEQARASSVASTSSSTSSADAGDEGIDGAPADSYCLWTPGSSPASSPARPRKSGSTGSLARWRRIGELVVGRSHSDGKEKFLFLSAPPSPARDRAAHPSPGSNSKSKQPPKGSKAAATELDTITAGRRMSYGGAKAATGGRRTFLPYRQDLVGLFANMQGISRSHHPF